VEDIRARISELAELMEEFYLEEACLSGSGWHVEFSRVCKTPSLSVSVPLEGILTESRSVAVSEKGKARASSGATKEKSAPKGTSITSPITGIFYNSPNPNSPPYVTPGDHVEEGQVIGLVEAMKVFNEIVSTKSGIASEYVAKHGALVQPGEVLIYIE
jgi:acetyl-CoA carboxylase biotin carboxyl carrier protein